MKRTYKIVLALKPLWGDRIKCLGAFIILNLRWNLKHLQKYFNDYYKCKYREDRILFLGNFNRKNITNSVIEDYIKESHIISLKKVHDRDWKCNCWNILDIVGDDLVIPSLIRINDPVHGVDKIKFIDTENIEKFFDYNPIFDWRYCDGLEINPVVLSVSGYRDYLTINLDVERNLEKFFITKNSNCCIYNRLAKDFILANIDRDYKKYAEYDD
jgi:hypothetical protein